MASCTTGKKAIADSDLEKDVIFPYDFSELTTFNLSEELLEISGLAYDDESDQLYAVEDENGIVYVLDRKDGHIIKKKKFSKPGDFEAIATVGNKIFAIKSSGTLHEIMKGVDDQKSIKFKTSLKKKHDIEGLTFDPVSNGLLISCKQYIDEDHQNERGVFYYDLIKKEMDSEPFLVIKREEMSQYIVEHYETEEERKKFKKIQNEEMEYMHFGPSSIAIHPQSTNIYVLSSQSKCLLVYDRKNKSLVHLSKLDKNIFEQPEGMCFDPLGNLYISSEGKKQPAKLIYIPINKSKIRS